MSFPAGIAKWKDGKHYKTFGGEKALLGAEEKNNNKKFGSKMTEITRVVTRRKENTESLLLSRADR